MDPSVFNNHLAPTERILWKEDEHEVEEGEKWEEEEEEEEEGKTVSGHPTNSYPYVSSAISGRLKNTQA